MKAIVIFIYELNGIHEWDYPENLNNKDKSFKNKSSENI